MTIKIRSKEIPCNDLGTGILFENGYAMNKTAYFIWEIFKSPKNISDGFREFMALFEDVSEATIKDDFETCVADLLEAQLIENIEE